MSTFINSVKNGSGLGIEEGPQILEDEIENVTPVDPESIEN